nr:uncharacterized protein LOC115269891 [Aedes albopictus]
MTVTDSSEPETKKTRTTKEKVQKFRNEWTSEPQYRCFEKYEKDESFAWCKVCLEKLSIKRGGKSNLTTHLATKRHRESASKVVLDDDALSTQAELKISAWAVENNISFNSIDKLADVLRTIDPESKVLAKITLGRTKATAVVDGVIAEEQHDELKSKMRASNFSLIIDESTDIKATKTLAMVVRICGEDENGEIQVRDKFYSAVPLGAADHRSIYNAIIDQFQKDDIPYKERLKGFASDGAAVMMGVSNSVMRLLKSDCPDMVVIKCTCHSLALCASYACEKIPDYLEHLLKDIYSYISNSPKRTSEFDMIQEILDLQPLKMLHPSATRWLSLEAVVKRCLDRFSELILFFKFQCNVDKNQTAGRILTYLQDAMTKPLLLFLEYILPQINRLNRLFQSEKPEFTMLHDELKDFFLMVLTNICEDSYVMSLCNGNATDFEKYLKTGDKIYVGLAAEEALKSMDIERAKHFRGICRSFFVELVRQLQKRFDLDDTVLKAAAMLNPRNISNLSSIRVILEAFPGCYDGDSQALENEFRALKLKISRNEVTVAKNEHVQDWWKKIAGMKRMDDSYTFPALRRLVFNILIMPHSSAAVERIFSQYNNNKTKLRNRLGDETMNSILKSKDLIKQRGGSSKIVLTESMQSKFCKTMYKHHRSNDN